MDIGDNNVIFDPFSRLLRLLGGLLRGVFRKKKNLKFVRLGKKIGRRPLRPKPYLSIG